MVFVRLQAGNTKANSIISNSVSFPSYKVFFCKIYDLNSEVGVTIQRDHGFGGHVKEQNALIFNANSHKCTMSKSRAT